MNHQAQRLDSYYRQHARDLPWRHTADPYRIWVSEIMLQQTRVEAVRDRYIRFLNRFPDVGSLAAAELDTVRAEWSGLGYYRRARYLWEGARYLVTHHNGVFPVTSTALQAIPGIGAYTACAVAAIAFGEPVAAVDGNVLRVGSRVLGIEAPRNSAALRQPVKAWADSIVQAGEPAILVQALMEVGAMVCTPRSVACKQCPFEDDCVARTMPDPTLLPIPAPRASRAQWRGVLFAGQTPDGELLLQRRPEKGLLAGLWFLPGLVGEKTENRIQQGIHEPGTLVASVLPGCSQPTQTSVKARWQFSHIDLQADIYRVTIPNTFRADGHALYPPTEWDREALPSVTRHLLNSVGISLIESPASDLTSI